MGEADATRQDGYEHFIKKKNLQHFICISLQQQGNNHSKLQCCFLNWLK